MPVRASQMAANEATVQVTGGLLEGETLSVVYYPNKLTTKAITVLDSGLNGMNQTLAEVIKSWDMLTDDDSMYPLDAESLAALGIGLLRQVAWAILADIRPN